jgi:hypothetical protein
VSHFKKMVTFSLVLTLWAISVPLVQGTAGCYFSDDHRCDCEHSNEAACKTGETAGLWTEECNCEGKVSNKGCSRNHSDDGEGTGDSGFTSYSSEQNAGIARWVLREAKWGSLTTASGGLLDNSGHDANNPDDSQPIFASILPFASDEATGRLFFYLMKERHFHSATFTVSQAGINSGLFIVGGCGTSFLSVVDAQDPRCAKLSVSGQIHPCLDQLVVGENCRAVGLEALFKAHPTMRDWPEDHQFTVHEFVPNADGFWMIANFGGGADMGGLEGYTNVGLDKIVPHDIEHGENIWVPPSQGFGFPVSMPKWIHRAKRARWVVHNSLWATVSTLDLTGDATFGNIRSVSDGATPGTSTGLPVFHVPDVDTTAVAMKTHNMTVALSFSEAAVAARVTSDGIACAKEDAGMPTCAQVVIYGKGVVLNEGSKEYNDALLAFKNSHPLASWLNQGGSHMSGLYYTVQPTRISILDYFGGAVDVDVDEYLAPLTEDGEVGYSLTNTSPATVLNFLVVLLLGFLGGCCGKSLWNCIRGVCSREHPETVYEVVSSKDGIVKPKTKNFRYDLGSDTMYDDELDE